MPPKNSPKPRKPAREARRRPDRCHRTERRCLRGAGRVPHRHRASQDRGLARPRTSEPRRRTDSRPLRSASEASEGDGPLEAFSIQVTLGRETRTRACRCSGKTPSKAAAAGNDHQAYGQTRNRTAERERDEDRAVPQARVKRARLCSLLLAAGETNGRDHEDQCDAGRQLRRADVNCGSGAGPHADCGGGLCEPRATDRVGWRERGVPPAPPSRADVLANSSEPLNVFMLNGATPPDANETARTKAAAGEPPADAAGFIQFWTATGARSRSIWATAWKSPAH